jgi:uroporphyrinogen III methyltransferase/synthase
VVTGTETPTKAESAVDWAGLARTPGTLVVLMGWESLPAITEALLHHGMSPDTPVALVRWGTEPWQRTVTGVLRDIVGRARNAGLSAPVVTVIGKVVDLREKLRWYDTLPLFGKRVLVTRTRVQASRLTRALAGSGAFPVEVPTIEIQGLSDYTELDGELRALESYDWLVFSSTNSVDVVFERLATIGRDARAFAGARIACIGEATAERLRANGILPDIMPRAFISESMVESFNGVDVDGQLVLVPGAEEGRDTLAKGLASRGARVRQVTAYRTVTPEASRQLAQSAIAEGIDIATFTSSSTVLNLSKLLGGDLSGLSDATVACIGPATAATARDLGLHVDIVASEHTIVGLVGALEEEFSQEAIQK